jgi:hypothetical protein
MERIGVNVLPESEYGEMLDPRTEAYRRGTSLLPSVSLVSIMKAICTLLFPVNPP